LVVGESGECLIDREQMDSCDLDVALVCMPFASHEQPSIGLSLLKSQLRPLSVKARILYFTIPFAERIGVRLYRTIGRWHIVDLLGDWVFSGALFPESEQDTEGYIRGVLSGETLPHSIPHFGKRPPGDPLINDLLKARETASGFLDECCEEILQYHPKVVGFTSLFHQQTASLALARLVKKRQPNTFIVIGGPGCLGPMGMEMIRSFEWIDAVVSGEGEIVFPEIVKRVMDSRPVDNLPGTFTRNTPSPPDPNKAFAPVVEDLDMLFSPDYEDFLEQWKDSPYGGVGIIRLPFETSRGCWWGEKSRCRFCGQGTPAMRYRTKSISRSAAELCSLVRKNPSSLVVFTDAVSNPHRLGRFLHEARSAGARPPVVYFEVRPDLNRSDLELLRETGIRRLEVGIESLSDHVLRLVRKGTNTLKNVRFLKWCKELGIEVVWNLLWGFPGEPEAEYEMMADLVPLLGHLQPPNYVGSFRLDRFSPYFERSHELGLEQVSPYPSYGHVYSLPSEALSNLAYYFTFRYAHEQRVDAYTHKLANAVIEWKETNRNRFLAALDHNELLLLVDGRRSEQTTTILDGPHRLLYLACDDIRDVGQLRNALATHTKRTPSPSEVRSLLEPLVEMGFMLRRGDSFLSLATRNDGNRVPEVDVPAAVDVLVETP
jgi:ribosomal peptide maturation radical SAM protein 1